MHSFIRILLRLMALSCQLIVSHSAEYLAQFNLPDNNQPREAPLGNIISKLQSSFPMGVYQIITRKSSFSKFNQFFRISDSGDLMLLRNLDRDDINSVCGPLLCCDKPTCSIILDVTVTVRQTNQKFPVRVLIDIADENDNSPQFMEESFTISMLENEKIFSQYSLPSAIDVDSSKYKIKSYTLSGKGEDSFTLKHIDDQPYLIPKRTFDFEDKSQRKFEFFLSAEDYGGKIGTLALQVNITDVNDNSPTCLDKSSNISVIENTTYAESIFTFRATDLDSGNNGKISYKFSATTVPIIKDIFRLNPDTGGLFLSKKLDYELYSEQNYKINIQVFDNGLPQLSDICSIEIHVTDINDNSPTVDVVQIQPIPENTIMKEHVLKFYVRDDDTTDNDVTCQMEESSPGLKLSQEENHSYLVYATGLYDREKDSTLTLLLVCQDSGKTPRQTKQLLTIPIKDKNDNYPKFTKSSYQTFVSEDFAVGKPFFNVQALDADSAEFGTVTYDLSWESKVFFSVNMNSGDIMLLKNVDRETKDFFNISLIATDGGNLKNYTVIELRVLDVNDNPPMLTFGAKINVTENVAHGSVIGHFLVIDLDLEENGAVEWKTELVGNASFLLEVDNSTIITVGDIDRETVDYMYVIVTMSDRGTPPLTSTATITISVIDQNDNVPEVTYPKSGTTIEEVDGMTIPTNAPRFTQVLTIKSYDPDVGINGKVLYHMQLSNGSKYFKINETDGQLMTNWAYDTLSFTPTHPKEGIYKISFAVYNQVKSTKNVSASSTSFFFVHVVPYRNFKNNEIFQQYHRRPFFNNVVLLILIGGFTISLSAALIAAIIWAKTKYSSESNSLENAQTNDGKFMMMMMNGDQHNTNNTYVYDPYCSLILDHERTMDSGYPLSHSRSSTFNTRRTGRDSALLNNYDNKTMPINIIQPDMARYCGTEAFNLSNSLSTTDLASSNSTNGRQPKLTNSFYRHFEHDTYCHSPILQSINQNQPLEHHYGSISPRAASICDPTPNISTTSNWIPKIPNNGDDGSNGYTIC